MKRFGLALLTMGLTACAAVHPSASADAAIPWVPLAADLAAPPAPSPKGEPVPPGTPACSAAELIGAVIGSQGATGHVVTSIAFGSSGSTPCFVDGTPSVVLQDAAGRDLGFRQHGPYMPPAVLGPALVEPGPRPEMHQGLKYGEAGFSIDWVSQPEACPGQAVAQIAIARISLPAGGGTTIALPTSPAGYPCQGVGVSSLEGPAIASAVSPTPALPSVTIDAPSSAKAGRPLLYTVTLTNGTGAPMNLAGACPNYEEELFGADSGPLGGKHFYRLNCAPAGTLGAGKSARFDMRFDIPGSAAAGDYQLVFMLGFWNAMSQLTPGHPVRILPS